MLKCINIFALLLSFNVLAMDGDTKKLAKFINGESYDDSTEEEFEEEAGECGCEYSRLRFESDRIYYGKYADVEWRVKNYNDPTSRIFEVVIYNLRGSELRAMQIPETEEFIKIIDEYLLDAPPKK